MGTDIAGNVRLTGNDGVGALRQRCLREAPRAVGIRRRGAEDCGALGQRHDRVDVARAGQRIDVGDVVGVRAAAVGAQPHRYPRRHRVVGEGQRGAAAGIRCDNRVRALGERGRREAPGTGRVRRHSAEDGGAILDRDHGVG